MQLGFVNFNTEEKKRVTKMMQLMQESEAIEELGIGRVRDYFSNTLFPGTSTLQHHAKYFCVLPSLYYHTAYGGKTYNKPSEVEKDILEAEIQITRQLAENEDGTPKHSLTGITGIATYRDALKDYHKYVKYDPSYIYASGMSKFGMIPNTDVFHLIMDISKGNRNNPNHKTLKNEELNSEDNHDGSGEEQIIITCGENYDFKNGKTMKLSLTEKESSFLKRRIHDTCSGTMLDYLINNSNPIPDNETYFNVSTILDKLDSDTRSIYDKSVLFSKLMHLVDWRYNYAYYNSFKNENDETPEIEATKCEEGYNKYLQLYYQTIHDIQAYKSLFEHIRSLDTLLTDFCESCYTAILNNEPGEIDKLVTAREYSIKRERSKIGNPDYRHQKRLNPSPNDFRWVTVRTMVNEIRNPQ